MHNLIIFVRYTFLILFFCCASLAAPEWELVWSDEFEGSSLNTSKWIYVKTCKPANQELQCYTDRENNVRVEDGSLVLHVIPEQQGSKRFTSGRINSRCDGFFQYGKFQARAKLPKGKHLWPAFWLIPSDEVFGGWPKSGEIDIFEARGQETSKISSALHYGSPHQTLGTGPIAFNIDFSKDYHLFQLVWNPKQMVFSVDDKPYWTVDLNKKWGALYEANGEPWDERFHVIVNVAVGGNFFGGEPLSDQDVKAWTQPEMRIDYIRVYQDKNLQSSPPTNTGLPSGCAMSNFISSDAAIGIFVGGGLAVAAIVGITIGLCVRRRRRINRAKKEKEVELQTTEEDAKKAATSTEGLFRA